MTLPDILAATRRTELNRRLRNAKARQKRAEDEIDEIEAELTTMNENEALEWLTSLRGVPDWPSMLHAENTTSVGMLRNHMLERMGFGSGFQFLDTKEIVVQVSVAAGKEGASPTERLEKTRRAIEFILPHLREHASDGLIWFGIGGTAIENFALNLHVSRDLTVVKIQRMVYMRVHEEIPFETLGEALLWIQTNHPADDEMEDYVTDPATAPGYTGEMLRRAIAAFVEGRRLAGLPIEEFSSRT